MISDVATKVQEIMSSELFIKDAINAAASSTAFKGTLRDVLSDALKDNDVIVVLNEQECAASKGSNILTFDNGIKALAAVGAAVTIYHGYRLGSKIINRCKE